MPENMEGKFPLGLCRQAVMKLDSFAGDIREIMEDPDIDNVDKENLSKMAEMAGMMMANIVNMVSREIGEEEFLSEDFEMDNIDEYPGMMEEEYSDDLGELPIE